VLDNDTAEAIRAYVISEANSYRTKDFYESNLHSQKWLSGSRHCSLRPFRLFRSMPPKR